MPIFDRVVLIDPSTLADFTSDKERGAPLPANPELTRLWDGLSVMGSEDRARTLAERFALLGTFTAALHVEDGGPIRYERTPRRSGHYTVWAMRTRCWSGYNQSRPYNATAAGDSAMMFELWNRVSGNAVGEFETIDAALGAVRQELATHGQSYVAEWLLAVADDEDAQTIAAGEALIALALGVVTA